ncbi:MAG: hypothetical protein KF729_00880 [Sandaracinaceae bacterium]|nr:hypothetical protein [Sandaracinaceae bacterium]
MSARPGQHVLLATIALALGACGPSADGYPTLRGEECRTPCEDAGLDAGELDAGPPDIPDEPLEDWDEEGAGPLTGIFAVEVVIPARAVVDVETRQLYRLRVLQRGEQVRMRVSPCRFSLPAVPSVATLTIPPRLEAILRSISIEDEGPFLTAADPIGATVTTPRATVLLGAALADPARDPLPTRDAPATALDQDEDGQPGVTVAAETVLCRQPEELYLALRASVVMRAEIEALDRFEGTVEPTLEQSVLGVSDRCLNAAATLEIEILDGSRFTALRAGDAIDYDENGNVSCPEIAYFAPTLFGDYWAR